MSRRLRVAAATAVVAGLGIAAAWAPPSGAGAAAASATLVDINGREVGEARFRHGPDSTLVARVTVDIDQAVTANPGEFHGLHLHVGSDAGCVTYAPGSEPPLAARFSEVGPHWSAPGQAHGSHLGDLPSLARRADGSAEVEIVLDKATVADLVGRALVVHHLADDFGKHPGVGTSATAGNAGARYACGVVERGGAGAA